MGIRYNPALDGVRALAIGTVVAGHYGLPHADEFHGVTVFFVLSGYLITSLLLAERDRTGGVDLRAFYRRRMARLMPALVVVVVLTVAWLLLTGVPLDTWWAGALTAVTYTGEAALGLTGQGHVSSWFLWSWSLAIEEQFYLLWPLALLASLRRLPERWLPGLLLVGIAVAWWLRHTVLAAGARHEAWLFGPQTHVDALLWGAVVAVLLRRLPQGAARSPVVGLAGLVGLTALVVLDHVAPDGSTTLSRWDVAGFGQTAMAATLVVGCVAAAPDAALARRLGAAPLRFLGRISYSLYLWNIVVFTAFGQLTDRRPVDSPWGWTTLVVLGLVSSASWRFVETPLRARWAVRSVSGRGGSPASPSSTSAPDPSAVGCSTGSRPVPSAG